MRNILIMILFASFFSLPFSACRRREEKVEKGVEISTAVASREIAAPVISAFGSIVYKAKADVYPTSTSNVKALFADKGMSVNKGDLLALLDDAKLQVQLRQAESDVQSKKALVALAKAQFDEGCQNARKTILSIDRIQCAVDQKKKEFDNLKRIYNNKLKLHVIGGLSDEELQSIKMNMDSAGNALEQALLELRTAQVGFSESDINTAGYTVPADKKEYEELLVKINTATLKAQLEAAGAELEAAQSQMENIKLYLEETKIKSPIDGIVAERYVDIGEKADAETRLFTLFSTESVYVSVTVNALRFNDISEGCAATVRLGNEVHNGFVEQVSPYADAKTGGRMLKIAVDNKDKTLIPGLFAEVSITVGEKQLRLSVPKEAVLHKQDDYSDAVLFLVRDGHVFLQKVDVDFVNDSKIFLHKGLKEGDVVAISRLGHLSDGCEVVVR